MVERSIVEPQRVRGVCLLLRRKRGLDADVQLAAVGKREPHAALRQEGRRLGDLGEAEVSAEKVARGRLTAGWGGDLSVVRGRESRRNRSGGARRW